MELWQERAEAIPPLHQQMAEQAQQRLAEQARPAGSLGQLEELAVRLAAINGELDVHLRHKTIVTCAGDHGVVCEGISLFPSEVTAQMVFNFVEGGASISVLAKEAGAQARVADLGVDYDFSPELPIFHKKVRRGTDNLAAGPAMSRQDAIDSINAGVSIVDELQAEGALDIIGTGDMGIGNTTPSAAIIATLSGLDPLAVTGRGTGLDDSQLKHKIDVVRRALAANSPDSKDPIDVLSKVGGLEIGGLAGLVIGAAAHGMPVVCDGFISTAGALIACELAPRARDFLFASHLSEEHGHQYMHKQLGIEPVLDLGLRLGEGTGAVLSFPIMDMATRVLAEIKTFADSGVSNRK